MSTNNSECNLYNWQNLPTEALVKVYGYLDDFTRCQMSLTCKHWHEGFNTPVLWRRRFFLFTGFRAMENAIIACKYLRSLGRYLRHIEVECGHPVLHTARPIAQAMDKFVTQINKMRCIHIVSFKMEQLGINRAWQFFQSSKSRLVSALCKFLKCQKHLRTLELTGAQLVADDGSCLIKALGQSQARKTLRNLYIENFYELRRVAYNDEEFLNTMRKLTALRHVFLNFIYVNETVLAILANRAGKSLDYLRIVVDSREPFDHSISPEAWSAFSSLCPKVKLVFHFLGKLKYSDYTRTLVKGMPLVDLNIISWESLPNIRDPERERMADVLKYVGDNFTNTLVHFRLSVDHTIQPVVDVSLIHLITRCSSLSEVSINCKLELPTVESICKMVGDRTRRGLASLELRVRGLTGDDMSRLALVTQHTLCSMGFRRVEVLTDGDTLDD